MRKRNVRKAIAFRTCFYARYDRRGLFLFLNDLGIGSVADDAGNTVFTARLGGITLRSEDDFAVRRLQTEAELTGFVLIDLKFGVLLGLKIGYCLVLDRGRGGIFPNAFNTVQARVFANRSGRRL